MGHHLRQRLQRKLMHRLADAKAIITFLAAILNSYRLAEMLPLTPLLLCLGILSLFPDWVLQAVDSGAEWALSLLLGGKCAKLRDAEGNPTGQRCLYSIVGALDPNYALPDPRLLCVPRSDKEKELAFPSQAAAGWGNATFLALCMKLAYEDWQVVRDVVNHEWRLGGSTDTSTSGGSRYLTPRFIQGSSFHFMQPIGAESSEELSHIHLDSDAMVLALEDTSKPATPEAAAAGAKGAGVAVVLAFRGTEPLELADFQSDFDAVPEVGEWGCLHPGFLLALGLDPNLNGYHQTLTTYSTLCGESTHAVVVTGQATTPYEVLRDQLVDYLTLHPTAKLYVTGHSLGGALAVVFMGALMHDNSKKVQAVRSRVGALYTFGQPRVGDYEFLCHLQVSLLEPSAGSSSAAAAAAASAGSSAKPAAPETLADAGGGGGHVVEHAMRPSGASKLRSLMMGRGKEEEASSAPPLTSRYIRVVNTFDIVPHIPPPLCNLYQHGGDLLYLLMTPGQVKFLTEQPMFFITGIWSSSLVKLHHYAGVLLGYNKAWKGRDNYLRFGMRIGAVLLPFLVAGLNDHMPGDYCASIINSDPAAWQPFKPRKKLSRWANAVMFTRALSLSARSSSARAESGDMDAAAANAAGTADAGKAAGSGGSSAGRGGSLSSRLQAQLMARSEKVQGALHRRPGGVAGEGASNGSAGAGADAAAAQDVGERGGVNGRLKALAHKVAPKTT